MNSNKVLGSILLSVAACIWGGMFVVVKIIVGEIHPIQLVWLRYLVAILFLVTFSVIRKEKWHLNWPEIRLIFLIGIIGNTISIVAHETGTWLSSAQTGAVITSATPTFMVIFAWLILKEKLNRVKITSVVMATIGVVMTNTQALTSIDFLEPKVVLCLLYLGVISTAMAFVMWNKGLTMVSPSVSGLFFLLQPIIGTLLGWLLLGESITWCFVAGSIMIIGSVWVSIRFSD